MRDLTYDEVLELAGAFVLGALEPAEEAAVRAHLATCGDAHDEIAELGGVLPVLAESVPIVEPPAGLRARIMAAAAADLAARSAGTPAAQAPQATARRRRVRPPSRRRRPCAAPRPSPFPGPERARRPGRARRASTGTWFAAHRRGRRDRRARWAGTCCSGVQLNAARSYEHGVAAVLEVAAQPGSLTAILTADGGTGSGLAAVSASGEVTIAMQDLAPTSGSQVYKAWVIAGDGGPGPARQLHGRATPGRRRSRRSGLPTAGRLVLALTREPGPGATTPTLPIISKGVATGAG